MYRKGFPLVSPQIRLNRLISSIRGYFGYLVLYSVAKYPSKYLFSVDFQTVLGKNLELARNLYQNVFLQYLLKNILGKSS